MTSSAAFKVFVGATAALLAVLSACGGGGPESSVAPSAKLSSYTVQTYITDNLATEYSRVWVSLKKITATDASGAEVTLFDATASPKAVNLSSLADVGQFLSSTSVPAGLYTQITVTLGNDVQLVSLDAKTTLNAKFNASGSDLVWKIRQVTLDPSTAGQLVLDFNLAKFTYNAATGIVTPTVDFLSPADAFKKFIAQHAHVQGSVVSVDAANRKFVLNDKHLGAGVVVTLAADAAIVDEKTKSALTLSQLGAGMMVEVKGSVTPGATTKDPITVMAFVVHVVTAEALSPAAPNPRLRGEGTISAISADGKRITVTLKEANFLPGSATVVVDVTSARFAHGQASDLKVGLGVEFSGVASGTGPTATVVAQVLEIAGAPSEELRKLMPLLSLAVMEGQVGTLASDKTSFTLSVSEGHAVGASAGTYTVDATKALFEEGSPSCLAVGIKVRAAGTLSGSTLTARLIDVQGCSGQTRSAPGK